MPLYFITGNANKFREAKAIIPSLEQLDLDLTEIQSLDPHEVIRAKLREARSRHDGEFVVEDTSLSLACLGGLPGTFIKWFLQAMGNKGLVDATRNFGDDRAVALTMIGHMAADGQVSFFEGGLRGRIVAPTGKSGFGWDPVFMPDGHDRSFQQMTAEEKNAVSMRGQAFRRLKDHLDRPLRG